jgi:riboflavin biosynthesis pyrimidine reductase
VLIITTPEGANRISDGLLPSSVRVEAVNDAPSFSAQAVLTAVRRIRRCEMIIVEAGPRLMGDFLAGEQLNELFLTLAPQVAGRDGSSERPGLVAGKRFAPELPRWGTLVGLRRAGSHLFLRYCFPVDG